MNLKNKKVLVLGLGITGISTIKALDKLGADIVLSDKKTEEDLKDVLNKINYISMEKHLNTDEFDLQGIDLIIKSPGIPPFVKLLKIANENGIEVITDIEFAYRVSQNKNFIAITGTNGKTTSTMLTGEILRKAKIKTHVVGNIGTGIMDKILEAGNDDVFVTELSSFQLEHTSTFKPKIGLITNITPDHLDWHGSFENYRDAKLKIFRNQDKMDYLILNYDDINLRGLKNKVKSKVIYFSTKEKLQEGIYADEEYIIINYHNDSLKLMRCDELKILGKHNLENALGCIGIAIAMGISIDILKEALKTFQGVEHRLEFVATWDGITFYNDSKGTNPDASMKAVEAVKKPIILIAGGYDKGSSYDEFIRSFNGKVKTLILLGQTKEKIKEAAMANNFTNFFLVNNMKEAVGVSSKIGIQGDNVLLSPACASWGMYKNYEERGKDFKKEVFDLME
jgi:UDP-N-acetylmuramoylalanine--D-glutamate ligase